MSSRLATTVLSLALAFGLVSLWPQLANVRLTGIQRGYEPEQPIRYSHRLHAGELQIPCQYCHSGAERSRHAGIPPVNVCMNCHKFVTAPLGMVRAEDDLAAKENRPPHRVVSAELRKLYDAVGLDENLQRDPGKQEHAIAWVKVYNVPDFAVFDHRPHVAAGVICQTCHGPVETMERMRQVPDLTMGWCVNCHRDSNRTGIAGHAVRASLDCSGCHY